MRLSADISAIMLQRLWQAFSGFVTMLFITHFLTAIQQGWYYSFLSIASTYAFFELGLSAAILQLSAKFFVGLNWLPNGHVEGSNSYKFIDFLTQTIGIYLILGSIFCLLILLCGTLFFWNKNVGHDLLTEYWLIPWILLVLVTTLYVMALSFFAVIEGSGHVHEVYFVRLVHSILASFLCWIVLLNNGGLWATIVTPLVGFLMAVSWLMATRPFLLKLSLRFQSKTLIWRTEIWPLQWRISLNWLCSYLLAQVYTPILFVTQGPIVAGQMGLSLTIVNMLGLLAQSWITRRVPAMVQSVSKRDWNTFDTCFKRDFFLSTLTFIGGIIVLLPLYLCLASTSYGARLLPLYPFVGLLINSFVIHVNGVFVTHLRSFCKEPLVWVSLFGASITLIGSISAASISGVAGMVTVMLAVQLFIMLPVNYILWLKFNREYRLL